MVDWFQFHPRHPAIVAVRPRRWRHDDITAIGPSINVRGKYALCAAPAGSFRLAKDPMTAAARRGRHRTNAQFMSSFRTGPCVVWPVNIDDDETGRGQANVGARILRPPAFDLFRIETRVFESMLRLWPTGAWLAREDRITHFGIVQSGSHQFAQDVTSESCPNICPCLRKTVHILRSISPELIERLGNVQRFSGELQMHVPLVKFQRVLKRMAEFTPEVESDE